jgi:hypothetical protein
LRRAVVILSCLIALPATARAESFSADFKGLGNAQTVYVTRGTTTSHVWAGELIWNGLAGAPDAFADDFYTYCLDLTKTLIDPQAFEVKDANSFAPDGNQVAWLVSTYAPFIHTLSGATANAMAAGLQMAIWNVLYDSDFDASAGSLRSSTTSAVYYANQYLGTLNTALATGPLTAQAIWLDTNSGQDQVTVVPEPGSILLLGIGTLAVLARRRRINAA